MDCTVVACAVYLYNRAASLLPEPSALAQRLGLDTCRGAPAAEEGAYSTPTQQQQQRAREGGRRDGGRGAGGGGGAGCARGYQDDEEEEHMMDERYGCGGYGGEALPLLTRGAEGYSIRSVKSSPRARATR